MADYRAIPDQARAAFVRMKEILVTGTSLRTRRPYTDYFQVEIAEIKGNLALYKIKLSAQNYGLTDFFNAGDLPIGWG